MTHFKFFLILLVSLILSYGTAVAGTKGYMCTVKTELHLNDDGSLAPYPNPLALGARFAVDRSTGHLVETDPSWWSTPGEKVSVLSHGNTENGFVAIYTAPAADHGVFHTTLRVEEFADGLKKPFLLTSGGSVYAGVCE